MGVSAPLVRFTLNTASPLLPEVATRRNPPVGSTASPSGAPGRANGEPTAVKPPDIASIVKADTVLSPALAVNRNFPVGSVATPCGSLPVGKGEPASWVNFPVAGSIEKAETTWFAFTLPDMPTYRNLPPAPIASPCGPGKFAWVGNGEPATAVNAPLTGSIV